MPPCQARGLTAHGLPLPLIYQKGRGEWKDVPTIEAGFGQKRNEIAVKWRRNLRMSEALNSGASFCDIAAERLDSHHFRMLLFSYPKGS